MNEQVEVRQCAGCAHAAVVLVNEWQHTRGSTPTGEVTREYRCQQCGRWFVQRSRLTVLAYWIAGVLLLPAMGIGLPVLIFAWRSGGFDGRVPVMSGALAPVMKFPGGPPKRVHAGCGGESRAVEIIRHSNRGVPTGTEYTYQCVKCDEQFSTESWWGHVTSLLLSLVSLGFLFAFLLGADSPWWKWGGSALMAVVTLIVSWSGMEMFINRFRHKVLPR